MNFSNLDFNINFENILYNTLSQDSHLPISRKMLSLFGADLALFIAFLMNQSKYHKENNSLTDDNYFYATDTDIYLFTGIPRGRISNIKKEGLEKKLYSIDKRGVPQKTYYKINVMQILEYLSIDKSLVNLAYERIFNEENQDEFLDISECSLEKLSIRDLRMLSKKYKIPYNGDSKKSEIIKNLLEKKEAIFPQTDDFISEQKSCPLKKVSKKHKSVQWTKFLSTSGQKNCHKHISNKHITNIKNHDQEEKKVDLDFFENLFKEFKINFTKTNQEAVKKLLLTLSSKKVEEYLRETYNNIQVTPGVKDPARLFSAKIVKGERQVIPKAAMKKIMHCNFDQKTEDEEILIKQEKKINREVKYLISYYDAGIKTALEVYYEIEKYLKNNAFKNELIEKYKVIAKEKLKIE